MVSSGGTVTAFPPKKLASIATLAMDPKEEAKAGGEGEENALPVATKPFDTLRNGLPALKHDAIPPHPLARAQADQRASDLRSKRQYIAQAYGGAALARQDIEEQVMGVPRRLAGMPSSKLGHEVLTGKVDNIEPRDFLGAPWDREAAPPGDVHSRMEARLGLPGSSVPRRSLP